MKPIAAEVREVVSIRELVARAKKLVKQADGMSWQLADTYAELYQRGWTQQKIADECGAVQSHVSYFLECSRNYPLGDNRPTFWEAYRDAKGPSGTAHVSHNSGENEWYTPPEYIEAARLALGSIDLDPASSKIAQKTVKASKFYTAEDDGLSQDWSGKVYLNPPYASDLVERFTEKLCQHVEAGDVQAAILLVNNATETKWFQSAIQVSSAICFPASRIKFIDKNGEPTGAPLQGQSVLYFGNHRERFVENFLQFGFCVKAWERIKT